MALYIEIKANNRIVDVVAARRLGDSAEENDYEISQYEEFAPQTFKKNTDPVATIKHRANDGALVLAEKAIHAINNR